MFLYVLRKHDPASPSKCEITDDKIVGTKEQGEHDQLFYTFGENTL